SMLPALAGKPIERSQPLYWRTHLAKPSCRVAVRIGDWKIVANDDLTAFELYNVEKDPKETTDLRESEPEKFTELKKVIVVMDRQVKAEGPDWWKLEQKKR